jgi:hypothetical protein
MTFEEVKKAGKFASLFYEFYLLSRGSFLLFRPASLHGLCDALAAFWRQTTFLSGRFLS